MYRLFQYKKLITKNVNKKSLKDNKISHTKEDIKSTESNQKIKKLIGETISYKYPISQRKIYFSKRIKILKNFNIKNTKYHKNIISLFPCIKKTNKFKTTKKSNKINNIWKFKKLEKKFNSNDKILNKSFHLLYNNNHKTSSTEYNKKSLTTSTTKTTATKAVKKIKKSKSKIYGFMKQFLKKTFQKQYLHEKKIIEDIYVEIPPNNNKNSNKSDFKDSTIYSIKLENYSNQDNYNNCNNINNLAHLNIKDNVMQDVRIRLDNQLQGRNSSRNASPASTPRTPRRPIHLFTQPLTTFNDNSNNNIPANIVRSPSSEEDNSPTEMNNCRKLVDKPPLVKRLTMGLLRPSEDSRPLVHTSSNHHNHHHHHHHNNSNLNNRCGSTNTIDGYVNEGILCEPEKYISSKFGDSCRQSLTAISTLDSHSYLDNSEFNLKKRYIRETMSANSSPKIFPPSLLKNKGGLSPTEQNELKGAAWFQAGISRDIAVEILSSQSPGSFLVRQSNTKHDCFVLSVRIPPPGPKVSHYLILRTIRGYKIKGFTKEFTSLRALITHHSVMPELLPIPLTLPRPSTGTPRRRNLDDFETYGSLRLLGILNILQAQHNDNCNDNDNDNS